MADTTIEKAATGQQPDAATSTTIDADFTRLVTPTEATEWREAETLQALRDGIVSLGLRPGAAVALFALCSSHAKAAALRMVAEREARS